MTDQTEAQRKLEELERTAIPASGDTEQALLELQRVQNSRRKDPVREAHYEHLRDQLARQLEVEGPRYFIDDDGLKRYAYAVVPEPVDIDINELVRLYEDGEISNELLDRIAPRRADKEAVRRAVSNGSLTREQFLRIATVGRGTAYVKYSDPVDAE